MQSLWARTAQVRCSCKCTLCQPTAPALSRPTTSAPLRHQIRFRDVFTVFYSTVLASAAIAEVGRKEAKRLEWERLIKEAKDDLKSVEDQQQARLAALYPRDNDGAQDLGSYSTRWDEIFKWASRKRTRRKDLGFQDLKGPSLDLLEGLSAPEIEALMLDKYIARLSSDTGEHLWVSQDTHRALSIKKVKTLEWSIRKLVHRLILTSLEQTKSESLPDYVRKIPEGPSQLFGGMNSGDLKTRLDRCERRLKFLARHSSNTEYWYRFESPRVPRYSRRCNTYIDQVNSLNIKLHEIFRSFLSQTMRKNALVAKICSTLLFSYAPPNIHTYNMLIVNLVRLKQMDDVQAVITSLRETHTRPNEVTLSAMLHYYTVTNNRAAFLSLLRKMEGQDGGLSLAHAATDINPILSRRYRSSVRSLPGVACVSQEEEDFFYEAEGYKFRPSGHKLRAKCHGARKVVETASMGKLNQAVYGAMIHGALHFCEPLRATKYYCQMVRDGWEAGRRELGGMLQYWCKNLDWESGLAVWQEICRLPQGADRTALAWMLQICRRRRKHVEFGMVLDYGVRQGLIPSTVWTVSAKISGGDVGDLLRSADALLFNNQLALPISVARDFLERNLETLGYRIASTALEFAEFNLNKIHSYGEGVGLQIFYQIKRIHEDSPYRSCQKDRGSALRSLSYRIEKDTRRQHQLDREIRPDVSISLSCGCCGAQFPSGQKLYGHLLLCMRPNSLAGPRLIGSSRKALEVPEMQASMTALDPRDKDTSSYSDQQITDFTCGQFKQSESMMEGAVIVTDQRADKDSALEAFQQAHPNLQLQTLQDDEGHEVPKQFPLSSKSSGCFRISESNVRPASSEFNARKVENHQDVSAVGGMQPVVKSHPKSENQLSEVAAIGKALLLNPPPTPLPQDIEEEHPVTPNLRSRTPRAQQRRDRPERSALIATKARKSCISLVYEEVAPPKQGKFPNVFIEAYSRRSEASHDQSSLRLPWIRQVSSRLPTQAGRASIEGLIIRRITLANTNARLEAHA